MSKETLQPVRQEKWEKAKIYRGKIGHLEDVMKLADIIHHKDCLVYEAKGNCRQMLWGKKMGWETRWDEATGIKMMQHKIRQETRQNVSDLMELGETGQQQDKFRHEWEMIKRGRLRWDEMRWDENCQNILSMAWDPFSAQYLLLSFAFFCLLCESRLYETK